MEDSLLKEAKELKELSPSPPRPGIGKGICRLGTSGGLCWPWLWWQEMTQTTGMGEVVLIGILGV